MKYEGWRQKANDMIERRGITDVAHFKRHCKTKCKYSKKTVAKHAAKTLEKDFPGEKYDVYKCKYCRTFHVGHLRSHMHNHILKAQGRRGEKPKR